MTNKELLSVGLRFWGVFAMVKGFMHLPVTITSILSLVNNKNTNIDLSYAEPALWKFAAYGMVSISVFVLAFFLFFKSDVIAAVSAGDKAVIDKVGTKGWEGSILEIALSMLGIGCLVNALPDIFTGISNVSFTYTGFGKSNVEIDIYYITGIVKPLSLAILGVLLFFGYKRPAAFLSKKFKEDGF